LQSIWRLECPVSQLVNSDTCPRPTTHRRRGRRWRRRARACAAARAGRRARGRARGARPAAPRRWPVTSARRRQRQLSAACEGGGKNIQYI
jgi:hypothetical protein